MFQDNVGTVTSLLMMVVVICDRGSGCVIAKHGQPFTFHFRFNYTLKNSLSIRWLLNNQEVSKCNRDKCDDDYETISKTTLKNIYGHSYESQLTLHRVTTNEVGYWSVKYLGLAYQKDKKELFRCELQLFSLPSPETSVATKTTNNDHITYLENSTKDFTTTLQSSSNQPREDLISFVSGESRNHVDRKGLIVFSVTLAVFVVTVAIILAIFRKNLRVWIARCLHSFIYRNHVYESVEDVSTIAFSRTTRYVNNVTLMNDNVTQQ